MVTISTGGAGTSAIIGKSYQPDGLIAGTTTQEGHQEHLIAEEDDYSEEMRGVNIR